MMGATITIIPTKQCDMCKVHADNRAGRVQFVANTNVCSNCAMKLLMEYDETIQEKLGAAIILATTLDKVS